jgi:hypothetical protein
MAIKWFNTERQAEKAKKRLSGTKKSKWVVQGNALVKIPRRSKLIRKRY